MVEVPEWKNEWKVKQNHLELTHPPGQGKVPAENENIGQEGEKHPGQGDGSPVLVVMLEEGEEGGEVCGYISTGHEHMEYHKQG